ncbi:MAG TPA: 3-phosphoshikimate 1-carboxyvinyltransferase [Candidatus Polarisedimenticolia bacterium]|nr:3-phosphoshikimate 1-carboxyvinyltransferase [Candidatus Polarisedimenticolia bacterium]
MLIPSGGVVDAEVAAPPSKSLTIRALAAAALADGRSALRRPLFSDDTFAMASALAALGIESARRGGSLMVEGRGGLIPSSGAVLDLGDAGTPLRLLTALCCLGRGRFVLDGSERMRQRPIGDLVEALRQLGVPILTLHGNDCPPVELVAGGFPGGSCRLRGEASSQFLSALLMAGPCGARDLTVTVEGELVSRPYVDLTLRMMADFGASVEQQAGRVFHVRAGIPYQPRMIPIEADASSASYFFAAAAVTGGRIAVTGIPRDSAQGDLAMLPILEAMGCAVRRRGTAIEVIGGSLRGVDADLADAPDLVPTVAAVALFAEGPSTLRRIGHLRWKESDRIEATAACARALGAAAVAEEARLTIVPPGAGRAGLRGAAIDPRGDHRLAMAFTVAGLAVPGVVITDPSCVSKSFPDFFDVLLPLVSGR